VKANAVGFEPVAEEKIADLESGGIWIATDHGIDVVHRNGVVTNINAGNSGLSGNRVTSLSVNAANTKWIAVWGRGVSCVDAEFNWQRYTRDDGLCSNYIISMQEDGHGNIWFGSKGRGVSCLSAEGEWTRFSSANSGLIGNRVNAIVVEPPGKVWFATPEGVSVFDGHNWMSYTSRNSPLGTYHASSMVIDSAGNKWIGTELGGLFKLDGFGMWSRFHKGNSSLPDNMITALDVDANGALWIGTAGGLCRLANTPPGQPGKRSVRGPPAGSELQKGIAFQEALMWENIGESDQRQSLSFSLPAFRHKGQPWFYAALWADQDFSFQGLEYQIVGDRRGTRKIVLNGTFAHILFLCSGGLVNGEPDTVPDRLARYPFPATYPAEVQEYLMPGDHLPANDPEIKRTVRALVRDTSRRDMYKTVR
ncbi:MAG: hypothetical protein GY868_16505, partial [Deltaproteobacteria bacterium]|nr:hypothetical protein [Deltaproteobacteria bacterium]